MSTLKYFILSFFIFNILFSWCDDICGPDIPKGAYEYSGYDSTGVKIVQGWLKIDLDDSTGVTGKWKFKKVGNPESIGPQIGTGYLAGECKDDQISINLNLNFIDNNVLLNGKYSEVKIEGDWMWVGFAGVINCGTFKAVK